jgi:hypothetical protein
MNLVDLLIKKLAIIFIYTSIIYKTGYFICTLNKEMVNVSL